MAISWNLFAGELDPLAPRHSIITPIEAWVGAENLDATAQQQPDEEDIDPVRGPQPGGKTEVSQRWRRHLVIILSPSASTSTAVSIAALMMRATAPHASVGCAHPLFAGEAAISAAHHSCQRARPARQASAPGQPSEETATTCATL